MVQAADEDRLAANSRQQEVGVRRRGRKIQLAAKGVGRKKAASTLSFGRIGLRYGRGVLLLKVLLEDASEAELLNACATWISAQVPGL